MPEWDRMGDGFKQARAWEQEWEQENQTNTSQWVGINARDRYPAKAKIDNRLQYFSNTDREIIIGANKYLEQINNNQPFKEVIIYNKPTIWKFTIGFLIDMLSFCMIFICSHEGCQVVFITCSVFLTVFGFGALFDGDLNVEFILERKIVPTNKSTNVLDNYDWD